jgi:hypothetical protein
VSRLKTAAAVTAALLALAVAVPRLQAQGEREREKYRRATAKGLEWLAAQQGADGRWDYQGRYHVPLTALAGTALTLEGSTTSDGKFARHLHKAVAFLAQQSQKGGDHDGLIGNPADDPRPMFGHGQAMEFLARAFGEEPNRERRDVIKDVLTRAVKYLERTQSARGGWFYAWQQGFDQDEGAVTIVQLYGLQAARNAGIAVNRDLTNKTMAYLRANTGPNGGIYYSGNSKTERPGLTAGAVVLLLNSAHPKDEHVKQWLKYSRRTIPLSLGLADNKARMGYEEFTHYFYARAAFKLGDTGWDRLFGERGADRLTWSDYRARVFDELVQTQSADGSWGWRNAFSVGPVYGAAIYLTILQLENDVPMGGGR